MLCCDEEDEAPEFQGYKISFSGRCCAEIVSLQEKPLIPSIVVSVSVTSMIPVLQVLIDRLC